MQKQEKMTDNVREWYKKMYADDTWAIEQIADITFNDVLKVLADGGDIYEAIAVPDSVVRERVFEGLEEGTGLDYDVFYLAWLNTNKDQWARKQCRDFLEAVAFLGGSRTPSNAK